MKAKGVFMFKNVQDRERGSFTNKETGEVISYNACKVLVADELSEDGKMNERRFKIDNENVNLINEFCSLEAYTKISIIFDVVLYSANAKVTPISFEVL